MLYTCHVTEVVYHGGGGRCSIDQKPPLIKKVYHKVHKYLFDYLKEERFTHLQ